MTEIKMSDEGSYALVIKGLIIIISVWIFGILLFSFVQSAFGQSDGPVNTDFIAMSFVMSIVVTLIICFTTGKVIQAILSIETREKELLIRKGLIFPKETKMPYTELKEARLSPTFFDFIDSLLGVSAISIEDSKVIVVNGVKNPIDVVKEINDRIASNKRKGTTMEDLAKEVKALRDEVELLKSSSAIKKSKETKKEESDEPKRGRFGWGPLEEGV